MYHQEEGTKARIPGEKSLLIASSCVTSSNIFAVKRETLPFSRSDKIRRPMSVRDDNSFSISSTFF